MGRLVALILIVAVGAGSPAGAVAQQPAAPTGADAANEDRGRPTGYTTPGYYAIDDTELNYQYYDGTEWSGPVVGPAVVGLYTALRLIGVEPEAVEFLTLALGGGGSGLYLALIVLALLAMGQISGAAALPPPSPGQTPPVAPSPSPLPTAGSTTATTSLSPNYRFVWNWGVTIGGFDGTVMGDAGGWTYTGASISSWPRHLHASGGTARCTFEGDPAAPMPEGGWPMDCDLYWQGDATWTGQIRGRFYPIRDEAGALIDFEFKGIGHGTAGDDWSPIEITLEPCEPGAVC